MPEIESGIIQAKYVRFHNINAKTAARFCFRLSLPFNLAQTNIIQLVYFLAVCTALLHIIIVLASLFAMCTVIFFPLTTRYIFFFHSIDFNM